MKRYLELIRRYAPLIGGGIAVILLIILIAGAVRSIRLHSIHKKETADGYAYLTQLETTGVDGVMSAIREKKRSMLQHEVDDVLAKIDSGETDVWSCFGDAVILGDSRADDFQYFGFLPSSRILADMGAMCIDAEQYLDTTIDLYPQHIFFTYGLNDVDGSWDYCDEFIEAYSRILNEFRQALPQSSIYVCSIIPVTQGAIDNDSNFQNLPQYNEAMKKMTDDLGLIWVDCSQMMVGHEDRYDTDGQHFHSDCYQYWAKILAKAAVMNEYGLLTADTNTSDFADVSDSVVEQLSGDDDESDE